jgi:hypothetical protein
LIVEDPQSDEIGIGCDARIARVISVTMPATCVPVEAAGVVIAIGVVLGESQPPTTR